MSDDTIDHWPTDLRGVTETVVTTEGPNERHNVAALGIERSGDDETMAATGQMIARTWGRTRTWRNFRERGEGYIHFIRDPVVFTRAALTIHERDEPVLDEAAAWVHVSVESIDSGTDSGTQWVDWALSGRESTIRRRSVPTFNRGYAAVIEATVAASRLDVAAYDTERLRERIEYFADVADRCGGPREREAFAVLWESIE